MKHARVCFIFSLIVFAVELSLSVPAYSSNITPQEIMQIAETGMSPFLGAIAIDYYVKFGKEVPSRPITTLEDALNPDSAISNELMKNPAVVLGNPFQVYTINTQDLLSYTSDVDISSIVVPTTRWFVPVFINNKARAMLTVNYLGNEWKVVNIGMGDVSEKVDKNAKMDVTGKGGTSKFVRIYPAESDFILSEVNGKEKVLPFSYASAALQLNPNLADSQGLYNPSDFMPQLINRVLSNIAQ